MKKTKKILAAMLVVLLLTTLAPVTFADDAETVREMWQAHATITEINDNFVLIKTNTGEEILLNTNDATVFLDNKTRELKSLSDLKAGDSIVAYYSPVMTRSFPPQTVCYAIITNIGDLSQANLVRVSEITKTDDGIKFLTADGDYIITVSIDTPVTAIDSEAVLTAADIKEGDLLFAWFGIVALSYPGQTNADAILIVDTSEDVSVNDPIYSAVMAMLKRFIRLFT